MMQDQQLPKPSKPSGPSNPVLPTAPASGAPGSGGEVVVKSSQNGQAVQLKTNPQSSNSPQTNTSESSPGDSMPPPSAMRPTPPTQVPATQVAAASQLQPQQQPHSQPAKPVEMPPTSLTALSSMSNSKLPQGAVSTLAPRERPEIQNNPNLKAGLPTAEPNITMKSVAQNAPKPLQVSSSPAPATTPVAGLPPKSPAVAVPVSKTTTTSSSTSTSGSVSGQPKEAKPKKSFLKFLPFVAIGLVVLVVVGLVISRLIGGGSSGSVEIDPADNAGSGSGRTTPPAQQASLEYWGLWEPSQVLEQVIADFQKANPGISIRYTKQSHKDYRERLQTAIASGNGPDIFRFHASWVPMMRNDLQPLPSSVISPAELKDNYYRAANEQLQSNGQPVGVPLMYEGLALLYNKDIFETAGENPPQTWAELRTTASKLTVKSGTTLKRGGIALGNSTNVDNFSDILGLLLFQNGADPTKPNSRFTEDALKFYTNFQTVDGVWDEKMPTSTVAFSRGEVAMIFAPSWRIHDVLAMNPKLNFGVAPIPKLSDQRIAWASFWAEGISARSKNKEAAQTFLKYISQPEVLEKLHGNASQIRSFGELYPRKDMADKLAENEYVAAYLQDAPYAVGWYLSSATHDNGINDQLIKYYADAVTAVAGGKNPTDVLTTIDLGTSQVLRQYGVDAKK